MRIKYFLVLILVAVSAYFLPIKAPVIGELVPAAHAQSEPSDAPPAPSQSFFFYLVQTGGWVVVLLMVIGAVGVGISIERWNTLKIDKVLPPELIDQVKAELASGNIPKIIAICESHRSPLARIVKAGLLKHNDGVAEVERAIETAGGLEIAILGKHLRDLGTMASISPMLGLFGTVTGMIKAFEVIATQGADPSKIASGIGEALLTTASGLVVAIPILVALNYFKGRIEQIMIQLEEVSLDLIAELTYNESLQ